MALERLRRVTRDGRWIPEIDGLRFLAIGGVLLDHVYLQLAFRTERVIPVEPRYELLIDTFNHGNRGVKLFFIISGMILGLPFARQFLDRGPRVSLRKYYLRRLTRLEPPYFAMIALFTVMLAIYQHGLAREYWGHLAASAIYMHSLIYGEMTPVNPVTWSLEVEIQFYLLAPLLMQVFRIESKWIRRGLLLSALALGWTQAPYMDNYRVNSSILFYIQYFLMGLLLADLYVVELPNMRTSWWWDLAGAVGLLCMFGISSEYYMTAHTILPLAMAGIFAGALRGVALRKFFGWRWVAVTGGMCYSIYLIHLVMFAAFFKVTRRWIVPEYNFFQNYLIQFATMLLPSVALCVVFYVLVERPCMDPDWPSKLWYRLTGRTGKEAETLDSAGIG